MQEALKWQLASNEYPANQGYAHLEYYARDAQVYFNIGQAYERTGDEDRAYEWFLRASEVQVKDQDAVYLYEKGLALEKLGRKAEARQLYEKMLELGKSQLVTNINNFFISFDRGAFPRDINTGAWYTQGVAWKALGNRKKARECFRRSLSERNDNLWAGYYLNK